MDANQLPNQEQAEHGLAQVAASRRAVIAATARPAWVDALWAGVAGATFGFMSTRLPWAYLVGAAVLTLGCTTLAIISARSRRLQLNRRHGRIADDRAAWAHFAAYLPALALFPLVSVVVPSDELQPWFSIGVGALLAGVWYAVLRWEERYQNRRLAAGDYHRFDLL